MDVYEGGDAAFLGRGMDFDYDRNASILFHIKTQVLKDPFKIALIDSRQTLSYRDFFESAVSVAKQLNRTGLKTGDCGAILVEPSCELIILIVAILINGASYVAIDKSYPEQRVDYLLHNSHPVLLIKDDEALFESKNLGFVSILTTSIDFSPSDKADFDFSFVSGGRDPAYITYTSGSTGNPKGIIVPHAAVNNHMLWMFNQFSFSQDDMFLLKTPLTFDPSVWEIFLPLYIGATLVIADAGVHTNPALIADYIQKYKISVAQFVPAILHRLLCIPHSEWMKSIRYFFVGGESLTRKTKKLFFEKRTSQGCCLINLYGPAEATIDTTFHEVLNTEEHLTHNYIGRPIFNTFLAVLNREKKPCQIGEVGELYIGGDNLGLGYVDKSENEGRFVQHVVDGYSVVLYKTGDLVRWTANRFLEYVGREDHQIKINGVRIELDELRRSVLACADVYDCLIDFECNETYQYKLLVCYLLPLPDSFIDLKALKRQLADILPTYMVPNKYFIVDQLCLSPNGKIDLRKAKQKVVVSEEEKGKVDPEHVFCRDKLKGELIDIWSSILNVAIDEANEKASFYDLGGDSISAFILVTKIEEVFSVKMSMHHSILEDTLDKQTRYLRDKLSLVGKGGGDFSNIVSLNSDADLSVFLVHPIGGAVFWYVHLARLLNEKIHVYGIADPGISSGEPLFNTISEMADYYSERILSVSNSKRCILGGASFGATVAVEIAKNLFKRGLTIESILAFDGWAVYPQQLNDEQYFHDSMLRQQKEWVTQFQQSGRLFSDFEKIFNIQMHRLDMLTQYTMAPFDFHLDIFKAVEVMPVFEFIDDPYNHWSKVAKNYTLHDVPGNHETMFMKPNVNTLASIMLDRFQKGVAASSPPDENMFEEIAS